MRTLNENELDLVSGGINMTTCDQCDEVVVSIKGVNTLVGGLLGSVGGLVGGTVNLLGGLVAGLLGSLNLGGLLGR